LEVADHRTIYVSDLDGTLLRNDGTISPYTKQKLIKLLASGLNFTIASARSVVSLQQALAGVPIRLPVIEINGGFISDLQSGRHLVINDMDKNLLPQVYTRILEYDCIPFVSAFNDKEDRLYYQQLVNEGMRFYYDDRIANKDRRLCHSENIEDTFGDHIVAFTVINTYDRLKDLAEEIETDFSEHLEMNFFENPYSPTWWWLTIHDKEACKSRAIKILVAQAGFTMDDLVVFGDNVNDVNMFKMACRAIAVQNAAEVLKKHATKVIGSNEDDSVVNYIIEELRQNHI
jgi:Cof subfamily protein (haloacid dehalogenase superfamily)